MMERIVPNQLTGSLDSAYFKDLDDVSCTHLSRFPMPILTLPYSPDRQIHHQQESLRHDSAPQLRPLLRQNRHRRLWLAEVLANPCSAL